MTVTGTADITMTGGEDMTVTGKANMTMTVGEEGKSITGTVDITITGIEHTTIKHATKTFWILAIFRWCIGEIKCRNQHYSRRHQNVSHDVPPIKVLRETS